MKFLIVTSKTVIGEGDPDAVFALSAAATPVLCVLDRGGMFSLDPRLEDRGVALGDFDPKALGDLPAMTLDGSTC